MSNQVSKKMEIRTARPQTLASALGGLIKIFGGHASDADLAARWGEIMGPDIGGISTLAGITKTKDKKFNIAIRPKNPAFALQLSYQSAEITKRINKYFGFDAVNKITFRK
ncbi:MAG: DUF721 domain-containing protein [Alphaproteobacteria bacterium]|nr:DUF721 domain-containing protein [Alphaproteobacteria bacterium]